MALPLIAAGIIARAGAKKLGKKLLERHVKKLVNQAKKAGIGESKEKFKPSVRSLNKLTHRKIDAAKAAERASIDKLSGPKYTAPKPKFDKPTPEMISKAGPVKITKYKKGK